MTLYVSLDHKDEFPGSPPFLLRSGSGDSDLTTVIQAIVKAKRIAVVCGAGISVEAGIPDFRSADGLFQSLKRDNPKESLSSGKDLFDASVFKSTQKTALFCQMIASLASLSSQGQPTTFHRLLRLLDDRKQLLRVYTQNIDALEMKAGLSFGVPEFEEKQLRVKLKGKAKEKAKQAGTGAYSAKLNKRRGKATAQPVSSTDNAEDYTVAGSSSMPDQQSSHSASPHRTKLNVIPRCIPLHGTLLTLHCPHCTQSFDLEPPPSSPTSPPLSPGASSSSTSLHAMLANGTPPPCPSCASLEQTRALVGKRLRGIGKLRPSVVLYGEEHREGEGVGEAVRRDLCGITAGKTSSSNDTDSAGTDPASTPTKSSKSSTRARAGKGPDLLLVVGTSLRVPGTKRIVREFSKAVRTIDTPNPSNLPTPRPTPPLNSEGQPEHIRTIYLNNEFPLPCREWEGVFDVWVNGDVQTVARVVAEAIREEDEKVALKKQKQKAAADNGDASARAKSKSPSAKSKGKRKVDDPLDAVTPNKRQKVEVVLPRTPASVPRPLHEHPGNTELKTPEMAVDTPKPRRVILRLPPQPPSPPTPVTLPRKRKRSLPEVMITRQPMASLYGSLSPLTSLSSLSGRESFSPAPSSSSSTSASPPYEGSSWGDHPPYHHQSNSRNEFHFDLSEDEEEDDSDEAALRAKTPKLSDTRSSAWQRYGYSTGVDHNFEVERKIGVAHSVTY
ncbi:hypothetical protein M422DRAFT_74023 [Sphaerobolus stellatus SS14]|nr:hypothetical protein M422DRAFT_74023 [Sphaerobolus stellatus SS14]